MKNTFKKVASAALAGSLLMSFAGCSFLDKSKDEVTLAAKEFCNAVTGLDAGKILEMSEDDLGEIGEHLDDLLTIKEGDTYTADAADLSGEEAEAPASRPAGRTRRKRSRGTTARSRSR